MKFVSIALSMGLPEKGTIRDLACYRIETAKNDLQTAETGQCKLEDFNESYPKQYEAVGPAEYIRRAFRGSLAEMFFVFTPQQFRPVPLCLAPASALAPERFLYIEQRQLLLPVLRL